MTVLNELHQDHVNLNKLLAVLSNKLDKLKGGELPNFILMADAVDYISNYADHYHHPREDEMYQFFQDDTNCPELTEAVERCMADHQALKKYSDDLLEAIDCILNDAVVPMATFAAKLESFLDHQAEHLNLEEGTLFPLLDDIITPQQWTELEARLPKADDPLFGELQTERYIELYTELLQDMQ